MKFQLSPLKLIQHKAKQLKANRSFLSILIRNQFTAQLMLSPFILLKLRNALYTYGTRFNYQANVSLKDLEASLKNSPPIGTSSAIISEIMNHLLNELTYSHHFAHWVDRPLLLVLSVAKQEDIQVKLDSLFTHFVQALVSIIHRDANHRLTKKFEEMDVVFEKNSPQLKAEAILFLIESVCSVTSKSKAKTDHQGGQPTQTDVEKKSQSSKDKYQEFVRRFYAHQTAKYIGEFSDKKKIFRVMSFKEDRSAVYSINSENGKISPISSLAEINDIVKKHKDSEIYETRQLILNFYLLISSGHLNFEPEHQKKIEYIKTQEIPLYKIVDLVLECQKVYSDYQDQTWGSRWKDDAQTQFVVKMMVAKTPKEVLDLTLYFWDNCGKLEGVFFPDNQPSKKCYNREHSVQQIRKMGGYKTRNITIKPLEKLSYCKELLQQQRFSDHPDLIVVYLCANIFSKHLITYTKNATQRIAAFRRRYQETIEEEPSRVSERITRRSSLVPKQKKSKSKCQGSKSSRLRRKGSYTGWLDEDDQEEQKSQMNLRGYFQSKKVNLDQVYDENLDQYCFQRKKSKRLNARDLYDV